MTWSWWGPPYCWRALLHIHTRVDARTQTHTHGKIVKKKKHDSSVILYLTSSNILLPITRGTHGGPYFFISKQENNHSPNAETQTKPVGSEVQTSGNQLKFRVRGGLARGIQMMVLFLSVAAEANSTALLPLHSAVFLWRSSLTGNTTLIVCCHVSNPSAPVEHRILYHFAYNSWPAGGLSFPGGQLN